MRISDWGSDVCSSDLQNAIFDEYLGLIEARVEKAREAGTLDLGVETIAADRISILGRTVIRRDPVSGAETEILRIETEERYRPLTLERAHWLLADPEARGLINPRSGKAAICRPTFSLTDEEGRTVRRYELVRPTRTERHRQDLFAETHWTDVDRASFEVRKSVVSGRRVTVRVVLGGRVIIKKKTT